MNDPDCLFRRRVVPGKMRRCAMQTHKAVYRNSAKTDLGPNYVTLLGRNEYLLRVLSRGYTMPQILPMLDTGSIRHIV